VSGVLAYPSELIHYAICYEIIRWILFIEIVTNTVFGSGLFLSTHKPEAEPLDKANNYIFDGLLYTNHLRCFLIYSRQWSAVAVLYTTGISMQFGIFCSRGTSSGQITVLYCTVLYSTGNFIRKGKFIIGYWIFIYSTDKVNRFLLSVFLKLEPIILCYASLGFFPLKVQSHENVGELRV
jgi:hypothetical protein